MKGLGILFMLINHLIAPSLSSWVILASGELARHLLIFAFMDRTRFRPEGYQKHAARLSLYLLITIAAVCVLQLYYKNHLLVQMPLVWLILTWLRPFIMRHTTAAVITGAFLWISALTFYLTLGTALNSPTWLSGVNLLAAGTVFPYFQQHVAKHIPRIADFPLAVIYTAASFIGILLYDKSQLDFGFVGLPLILLALSLSSRISKLRFPRFLTRFSLPVYVLSLWVLLAF